MWFHCPPLHCHNLLVSSLHNLLPCGSLFPSFLASRPLNKNRLGLKASFWRWILGVWYIPSPISTGRLLSSFSLHSQNQDELTWRQAETLFQVYCIKNPLELFYSSATFLGQLSSRFVMSIALPIPRRYSGGQQDLNISFKCSTKCKSRDSFEIW